MTHIPEDIQYRITIKDRDWEVTFNAKRIGDAIHFVMWYMHKFHPKTYEKVMEKLMSHV